MAVRKGEINIHIIFYKPLTRPSLAKRSQLFGTQEREADLFRCTETEQNYLEREYT